MRARTPALAGVDPTVVVEDHGQPTTLESKYTVDEMGNELLLYGDAPPAHRRRDRRSVLRSRLAAALPAALRRRLSRRLAAADRVSRRPMPQVPGPAAPNPGSLATSDAQDFAHPARQVEYDHAAEEEIRRAQVTHVLRAHGVPATVLPAGLGKPATVVVRHTDLPAATAALAADLDHTWRALPLDDHEARGTRVRARRLARLAEHHGGFRLYRRIPGPAGAMLGRDVGVEVEVWTQTEPADAGPAPAERSATLVAPRRQTWTPHLTGPQWHAAVERGAVDVGRLPHLFEVTGPIDVVYTWVDGSDPEWNAQRLQALGFTRAQQIQEAATHAARYRSHDELRYSLRSLEMFAPWVRTVHLVTAGQVPDWLDTDHPRLHLVDHRDIFTDPDVLPVFNSHAIESQLHHIPGLSERYLYLNDDVFFGRPVAPSLFFHGNGLAKFFTSTALIDAEDHHAEDVPVMSAAKNNRDLIADMFGRRVTNLFQHTPHPQLKSVLEQMEADHPDLFAQVSASPFRHPDDLSIASALHHYYAYGLGKAVPGRLASLYLDLAHPRAAARLRRLLRERRFDVFCLNDSPAVDGQHRGELVQDFLQRYFPLPSSFELPDGETSERRTVHREAQLGQEPQVDRGTQLDFPGRRSWFDASDRGGPDGRI